MAKKKPAPKPEPKPEPQEEVKQEQPVEAPQPRLEKKGKYGWLSQGV